MAFAEYRVCILTDDGTPGEPFELRADIDDPTVGDKLWIDAWYEVVDVAHAPDVQARTSPKTTFAQVYCRLLAAPPKYLLDLAGGRGGARLVQLPAARDAVPDVAGPIVARGLAPTAPDKRVLRADDAHAAETLEQSISMIRTFQFERPAAVDAVLAARALGPDRTGTQRVFVVEGRATPNPTLRLLASTDERGGTAAERPGKAARPAPTSEPRTIVAKPAAASEPKTAVGKPAVAIEPKTAVGKPAAAIEPKTAVGTPAVASEPKTAVARPALGARSAGAVETREPATLLTRAPEVVAAAAARPNATVAGTLAVRAFGPPPAAPSKAASVSPAHEPTPARGASATPAREASAPAGRAPEATVAHGASAAAGRGASAAAGRAPERAAKAKPAVLPGGARPWSAKGSGTMLTRKPKRGGDRRLAAFIATGMAIGGIMAIALVWHWQSLPAGAGSYDEVVTMQPARSAEPHRAAMPATAPMRASDSTVGLQASDSSGAAPASRTRPATAVPRNVGGVAARPSERAAANEPQPLRPFAPELTARTMRSSAPTPLPVTANEPARAQPKRRAAKSTPTPPTDDPADDLSPAADPKRPDDTLLTPPAYEQ